MAVIETVRDIEAWERARRPAPLGPALAVLLDRLTWRLTNWRAWRCPECPDQWLFSQWGATSAYCASHPLWGEHPGTVVTMIPVALDQIDPILLAERTGLPTAPAPT